MSKEALKINSSSKQNSDYKFSLDIQVSLSHCCRARLANLVQKLTWRSFFFQWHFLLISFLITCLCVCLWVILLLSDWMCIWEADTFKKQPSSYFREGTSVLWGSISDYVVIKDDRGAVQQVSQMKSCSEWICFNMVFFKTSIKVAERNGTSNIHECHSWVLTQKAFQIFYRINWWRNLRSQSILKSSMNSLSLNDK